MDYHPNAIYKLLEQLGFNWITSRSKHPKQAIEAQTAFKKVPVGNDPYTNQYKNLLSSERFLAN
ncbi:hypothetical protein TUM4438_04160 [Shewanella sairae]|uniref:Winged helix-turn helix domain-containing protein n=1 Tax=Shewanella sairae TaxID=190310 RepID=A0ABQ4P0T7_9GAMM|nr:hypothetical protein TUM4438_04160 [Shewanella sairae]